MNLGQWIESVREKPESVRRRYVFMCVAVSMVFIFGVWLLTVTESFQSVSSGAQEAAVNTKGILPKASNFSLDGILQGDQSLGSNSQPALSGQQYFDQQQEQKTQPNFNDEGVQPVGSDKATSTPPATAPPLGQ